ncbi:MAG: hypothetical protein AB7U23_14575 [Dehalococcoidia bacterium]
MTRHAETMQSACERAAADRTLACARRLRDMTSRTPAQQAAYEDAVAAFKRERRTARAFRAPTADDAMRTVWTPLTKGRAR